jgi:hypothetical protein
MLRAWVTGKMTGPVPFPHFKPARMQPSHISNCRHNTMMRDWSYITSVNDLVATQVGEGTPLAPIILCHFSLLKKIKNVILT